MRITSFEASVTQLARARRFKRICKRNTWVARTCLLQQEDEAQVTCRVRHLVWLEVERDQALTVFSLAQSEWVVNKEFAITEIPATIPTKANGAIR